jgi:nucleolar protein 56
VTDAAWFAGLDPDDVDAGAVAIRTGGTDEPADWPGRAIEAGFAVDADDYYGCLHAAALAAAETEATRRERAGDQQLIHAVRSMDDCARTANELAERLAEWAGRYFDEADGGLEGARAVASRRPTDELEARIVGLADRIVGLDDERLALRRHVERTAPSIAPNLSALAGAVLAARLIALAGGLEALAKKPSGTVQLLGAEDALFAHLHGRAPPPKHGVIFTHEAVWGTRPEDRGSAARALAGKLAIAARIDHYAGDPRPELVDELADRIARIRSREDG